jgi:peptide deformylase
MSDHVASSIGVLQLGDPRLRVQCPPVDFSRTSDDVSKEAERLCQALHEFREKLGFGRAIAAPQLGIGCRMIAIQMDGWPRVIINPQIEWHSEDTITMWDDCMSFPSLLVKVKRWKNITIAFRDEQGNFHRREDLPTDISELLQHEMDHLDGVLAVDRAMGTDGIIARSEFEGNREFFLNQVSFHYR